MCCLATTNDSGLPRHVATAFDAAFMKAIFLSPMAMLVCTVTEGSPGSLDMSDRSIAPPQEVEAALTTTTAAPAVLRYERGFLSWIFLIPPPVAELRRFRDAEGEGAAAAAASATRLEQSAACMVVTYYGERRERK